MQGECLAFADDSFDLVFGNAVLHHLDIATAAREIYSVLKPGGVAIFREPLGENRGLEWIRNCPFRSSNHRHTEDEHSLLYRDVDTLRTVFPKVVFRESELLSVLGYLLRKAEVGMIAVPGWAGLCVACKPRPMAADSRAAASTVRQLLRGFYVQARS